MEERALTHIRKTKIFFISRSIRGSNRGSAPTGLSRGAYTEPGQLRSWRKKDENRYVRGKPTDVPRARKVSPLEYGAAGSGVRAEPVIAAPFHGREVGPAFLGAHFVNPRP